MKKRTPPASPLKILAVTALLISSSALQADWPERVHKLEVEPNTTRQIAGNLSQGAPVANLRWAERSNVACFPGTRFQSYRGAQVFYGTRLPRRSVMKIKVQPASGVDVNLYAYMVSANDYASIPPAVTRVTSCNSSENFGRPNPGGAQQVELNATTSEYNVVIVVAGPAGVTEGDYDLSVDLATAAAEPDAPDNVTSQTLEVASGSSVEVEGDLGAGVILPLDWANTSQLACFPSHHNQAFRGKHVFYRVALPAYSQMKITVTPSPGVDVSLYGIRLNSSDTTTVPPNVGSGVCDANYSTSGGDPGAAETLNFIAIGNPYMILIGIAGPAGTEAGDFTLQVEVAPR